MFRKSLLLIALLLGASQALAQAMPDRCNAMLTMQQNFGGTIRLGPLAADEQWFEWLRGVSWQAFSSRQDAGLRLVLPVEGEAIAPGADGKYSKQAFDQFVAARESGRMRFFTMAEMEQSIERTAGAALAKEWSRCSAEMSAAEPRGLTCWVEQNDEQENGTIVYRVRFFKDPTQGPSLPVVAKGGFMVTGATVVDEVNPLKNYETIPDGGVRVNLKREGKSAVTLRLRPFNKRACDLIKLSAVAENPAPRVRPPADSGSRYYVTGRDETLRGVALRVYENLDWRKLLDANREVVKDPNRLEENTVLRIP